MPDDGPFWVIMVDRALNMFCVIALKAGPEDDDAMGFFDACRCGGRAVEMHAVVEECQALELRLSREGLRLMSVEDFACAPFGDVP